MELRDKDYSVTWEEATSRLIITGTLRLMTREYQPIAELLAALQQRRSLPRLELDVTELRMINSSGLNVLSRFVLGLRRRTDTRVVFRGSRASAWQSRALVNLRSFLPAAVVELS